MRTGVLVVVAMLAGCGGTVDRGAADYRGTGVWTPGTLRPGEVAVAVVSVPGAAAGDICNAGVLAPAPSMGLPVQCIVTAPDACTVSVRNPGTADLKLGPATFYCQAYR